MESEDTKQITTAIKAVLRGCILTKGVKVDQLPTFDIEYLFLNIRGKSVGEEVELKITAPDDGETEIPITINIDEIEIQNDDEHTKQIKVDDNLMMEMKYPSLDQFIKSNFDFSGKVTMENSFSLVASCVDKIYSADEVWSTADCTKKEVIDFLEQMNSGQFKEVEKFLTTMPKLSHTVKVRNPVTEVESDVVLEGLSSFFG